VSDFSAHPNRWIEIAARWRKPPGGKRAATCDIA
jgi:hypothetical protein